MPKDFLPNNPTPKSSKKKKKVSSKVPSSNLKKKRKKINRNPPLHASTKSEKLPSQKRVRKPRSSSYSNLSAEEQKKKRSEAAKKAAQTRKENEANLSPEERELLREKRRIQFIENMRKARERKQLERQALSPDERKPLEDEEKSKRSEAAKKAAKTRKENEAKLSPEEREELHNKRAEQARKNFGKNKPKINLINHSVDIASEVVDEIEEELAYEKYDNFIAEINQGYNHRVCARLVDLLKDAVDSEGIIDTMERIEKKLDREDLNFIIFADSDPETVVQSIQAVVEVILGDVPDWSYIGEVSYEIEQLLAHDISDRRKELYGFG